MSFLTRLRFPAAVLRLGINLWPPFVGAGIHVTKLAATADGAKYEPTWNVDIVDDAGTVIATVEKTLYIRRISPSDKLPPS